MACDSLKYREKLDKTMAEVGSAHFNYGGKCTRLFSVLAECMERVLLQRKKVLSVLFSHNKFVQALPYANLAISTLTRSG
jgi:hypothetical protein